jgi:hypothetical protein
MNESAYQLRLIKKLHMLFPGCFVLKNDPSLNQGIPDILILFENHWAMLEVKLDDQSRVRPNQRHYVDLFDEMSFASFINPKIENEVLHDLQFAFGSCR